MYVVRAETMHRVFLPYLGIFDDQDTAVVCDDVIGMGRRQEVSVFFAFS